MSTILGISDKEIKAIADAENALYALYKLSGNEQHKETAEILRTLMRRSDMLWGTAAEARPGQDFVRFIQRILPPEEGEELL